MDNPYESLLVLMYDKYIKGVGEWMHVTLVTLSVDFSFYIFQNDTIFALNN